MAKDQTDTGAKQESLLPPGLTETAEFKAAVQAEAKEAMTKFFAELKEGASLGEPAQSGDRALMSSLALALADLTGQGSGKKYVAPEILRQRAEAAEKMHGLIADAFKARTLPSYQLINKVLIDDQLIEPFFVGADHIAHPTEIGFYGVPNEAMVPLNEPAKAIHGAFMESIGSTEKVVNDPKFGVTPKGLVVKNGAVQHRREVVTPQFGQHNLTGTEFDENQKAAATGVSIGHKANKGQQKQVRVLGSIAAPAVQNQ